MDDAPVVAASKRRDLLDDIVAADEAAAKDRERKEKRVFRIAASAVVVLAAAVGLFAAIAFMALDNQADARTASTRRIDRLNEEISELGDELTAEARTNGERIGELSQQVVALQEQVRQLGGDPVVVNVAPAPTTATTRAPTTTTAPSTTTTTQPPPDEEPAPDDGGFCVLIICVGA